MLDEGSMPKVLAINVSKFTTSLYIAEEEVFEGQMVHEMLTDAYIRGGGGVSAMLT